MSVLLNDLGCYGYESSIFMCRNQGFFSPSTDTCASHNNDLGVQCYDIGECLSSVMKEPIVASKHSDFRNLGSSLK